MEPIENTDRLVGRLVKDVKTGVQYRVVRKYNNCYECVVTNTKELKIIDFNADEFVEDCRENKYMIVLENPEAAFSDFVSEKWDYELRRNVITELKCALAGNLLSVMDRNNRTVVREICDSFGIEWSAIKPWLIRYIQSGEQDYALRMKKNIRRPILVRYAIFIKTDHCR